MQSFKLYKAGILMLSLVLAFTIALESYWRSRGFKPSSNDDKVLWASQRKLLAVSGANTTVFVGGSRIKFDIDLPTWEKITDEKAIQLAMVATPGRIILRDLANDKSFRGKVVVDVMEVQFFSSDTVRRDKFARDALDYYYKETPAQSASAAINKLLESRLVFLEEGKFGMNELLNGLLVSNRKGVTGKLAFPKEFSSTSANRQTSMTPMFLANAGIRKKQMGLWSKGTLAIAEKAPRFRGDTVEVLLKQIKQSVDKICARGGSVIFVRPPSNGPFLEVENRVFPRHAYWDRLLEFTNAPGIHFTDYPETSHLVCPEWSHLSPEGARTYTKQLVRILQAEKGWSFSPNISN